MILLGIDPGPEICGVVLVEFLAQVSDGSYRDVLLAGEYRIDEMLCDDPLEMPALRRADRVLCEDITPQLTIGASTIETCKVIGGLREAFRARSVPFELVARVDVKRALCGTARVKDAVIIEELKRRGWIVRQGRGNNVRGKHCPQALAVVVAWLEMQKETA